jgi:hypothetical protein
MAKGRRRRRAHKKIANLPTTGRKGYALHRPTHLTRNQGLTALSASNTWDGLKNNARRNLARYLYMLYQRGFFKRQMASYSKHARTYQKSRGRSENGKRQARRLGWYRGPTAMAI